MKKLLLILLLFTSRAQAECISASHVEQIGSVYQQFSGLGKVCDTQNSREFAILKALLTLRSIRVPTSSVAGFDDLSVPVIPDDWSKYLSSHVREFRKGSNEACTANVLAYTNVRDTGSAGVMYVCDAFAEANGVRLYEGIATLLHEARHLEFNVDHVACVRGKFAGEANSCDRSMTQKGSYAVSIQTMAKMGRTDSNLNPIAQTAMRNRAIAVAFEQINETPHISREQKPLFLTTDGRLQSLGKEKMKTMVAGLPDGFSARYESKQGPLVVIYPVAEQPQTYIDIPLLVRSGANPAKAVGQAGTTWDASLRAQTVGVHFGSKISLTVKQTQIDVTCNGVAMPALSREQGLTGLVYPEGYSADQTSVFVLDSQDNWGRVRCGENTAVVDWQKAPLTKLTKLVKVGKETYGISHGGHLIRLGTRNGRRVWTVVAPAKSIRYRDVQSLDWIRFTDQN